MFICRVCFIWGLGSFPKKKIKNLLSKKIESVGNFGYIFT